MTSEANIEKEIALAASEDGNRLLRNNVGAYKDKRGMWIKYGVGGVGGSDEIGWTSITITPEMVGRTVPVFTAIEAKSANGRLQKDQKLFLGSVERAGGVQGVARSVKDYRAIIADYILGLSK
jgi:hypothetical protein